MIHTSSFQNARLSNESFIEAYDVGSIIDHSNIEELSLHYDGGLGVLPRTPENEYQLQKVERFDERLAIANQLNDETVQEGFDSYQ